VQEVSSEVISKHQPAKLTSRTYIASFFAADSTPEPSRAAPRRGSLRSAAAVRFGHVRLSQRNSLSFAGGGLERKRKIRAFVKHHVEVLCGKQAASQLPKV
jgi:hypothetical protein